MERRGETTRWVVSEKVTRFKSLSGAKGIRTPDLLIANETRYQLRHSPRFSTLLLGQERSDTLPFIYLVNRASHRGHLTALTNDSMLNDRGDFRQKSSAGDFGYCLSSGHPSARDTPPVSPFLAVKGITRRVNNAAATFQS